jgi:galactokinase
LTEPQSAFAHLFGAEPRVRAQAHGRVNLIGEHTDYNDGFVLPALIPGSTRIELAPHANLLVRAHSDLDASDAVLEYELGSETRRGLWIDYMQGVTHAMRAAQFDLEGFDARVSSDIPIGSGLASSAALTVALLRALRDAFGLALDDVELAKLARAAETDFVGAPVGVMDQIVCSLGRAGEALLIDTRSLAIEHVPLPRDADILVIDSGVPHAHAGGDYRLRREECARAAALLGVRALREIRSEDDPRLDRLPVLEQRRARHVVAENGRVLAAAALLRAGDSAALGPLLNASHASLRDDFEVSCPELDTLVALAQSQEGTYGARMTGGGFGGSIVALVALGLAESIAAAVCTAYAQRHARSARWFVVQART